MRLDMRVRWIVAVALMGLLGAGVTACGSSSAKTTPSVTMDPAFRDRLESVCAADYAGMVNTAKPGDSFPYPNFDVEHPDPGLLPKVGAFFAPNIPYWQRLPGQLAALGEPATNAAAWDQLRDLERQKSATGVDQIHAAENRDAATFVATAHSVRSLTPRLTAAEDSAGVPAKSRCRDAF